MAPSRHDHCTAREREAGNQKNMSGWVPAPIYIYIYIYVCVYIYIYIHTGCPRRNVPDFGKLFLMLKYTDITQNTYVQS